MGALLTLPISLLNFLLPFTKPGTPLAQDIVHTAVLCGTLYYAPQIAEWYNARQHRDAPPDAPDEDTIHQPGADPAPANPPPRQRQRENLPLDERLVLQPSDDEDDAQPPPLAPTPPFNQQNHNIQEPPLPQPHDAGEGPANPNPDAPRNTPANRTVGAKKAKSLARKDQRRAYHEFHRQEAELRRLREQEGAEEREAELAAEKERRAKIEADIAAKEKEERARRKEEERREQEEENERRERVVDRVRREVWQRGCVDLLEQGRKEGKDRLWVTRLVKASGLLSQLSTEGSKVMITGDGWLVKVDQEITAQAYRDAEMFGAKHGGRVGFEELGGFMERAVRARAKA
ncbi:hypothetical protein HBI83_063680 [Parastagonospora nodorum]|nr:hypothetical protein HBI83_063680 [Parastagonospora nodorum]